MLSPGASLSPGKKSGYIYCRQQDLDRINMLLQDPRPLEDKRDDLAKVLPASYTKMLFCMKR